MHFVSTPRTGFVRLRFPSHPVRSRKRQHQFRHSDFLRLAFNPNCPVLRKVPAEHACYVEKRAAPADHAGIMGAVADNLALGAQDGILQRNRIEKPATSGGTFPL